MSGEVDASVSEPFREVRNDIQKKLKVLEKNDYGSEVESLGVIPIVACLTPELENAGFFKERQLFSKKKKDADFRLRINYEKFINADEATKRLLVIKNVIDSVRLLSEKAKKDFDAKRLEADILAVCEVSKETIDSL